MKPKLLFILWGVSWLIAAGLLYQSYREERLETKPIYDESVDGSKQLFDALTLAKKENKRVFVQFGANWCVWCRRVHKFIETNRSVRLKLQSDYVEVLVDVNGGHNHAVVAQCGEPTRFGLPVFVILDADGKVLVTEENGGFIENGSYNSARILAFLDKWAP